MIGDQRLPGSSEPPGWCEGVGFPAPTPREGAQGEGRLGEGGGGGTGRPGREGSALGQAGRASPERKDPRAERGEGAVQVRGATPPAACADVSFASLLARQPRYGASSAPPQGQGPSPLHQRWDPLMGTRNCPARCTMASLSQGAVPVTHISGGLEGCKQDPCKGCGV